MRDELGGHGRVGQRANLTRPREAGPVPDPSAEWSHDELGADGELAGFGDDEEFQGVFSQDFAWLSQEHDGPADPPAAKGADDATGYRFSYSAHKAGMNQVDRAKINARIAELSKGSAYYENEERKSEANRQRELRLLDQVSEMRPIAQSEPHRAKIARRITELEATRDLTQTIVHLDMNAFYASVEERDLPELKTKPMAVGSTMMLCTANYEARKYGVRAAMPGYIAQQLCPELVIIPLHFDKYRAISDQVRALLREYDPDMRTAGLDECYLNLTTYMKSHDLSDPQPIVQEMRDRIIEKTQLTASAGIAPDAMLAKVCSDLNKPNGQYYLAPDRETVVDFTNKLLMRRISGVGRVTEHLLKTLGVETCADFVREAAILSLALSEKAFGFLLQSALGLGNAFWSDVSSGPQKSISTERTFRATRDAAAWDSTLAALVAELHMELESTSRLSRHLTVKVKSASFRVRQAGRTLHKYTTQTTDLLPVARTLLTEAVAAVTAQDGGSETSMIRLLGVRVSDLIDREVLEKRGIARFLIRLGAETAVGPAKSAAGSGGATAEASSSAHAPPSRDPVDEAVCPVCHVVPFPAGMAEAAMVWHIDECLNLAALRAGGASNAVGEPEAAVAASSRKRAAPAAGPSSPARPSKKPARPSARPSARSDKSKGESSGSRTLDDFFAPADA
ncbi:hypothetical protein AMAG_06241 [Allomyces macrogynus ATCC 38327]|uniref:DNA polymerase kappa n=1 Tax=Allomyces macrogynus (strain ATCC 38327) TaxID=578462 RepID=A0A0L0SFY2_ALLM3|nr:hypothetical protein AMAG_06241 [Allomyces macrogynus ATCC 38327]|eukprot:KNE61411.1 hypothetical protein AMAG_06241 [Allomyces macrogynus ATCC 38327]